MGLETAKKPEKAENVSDDHIRLVKSFRDNGLFEAAANNNTREIKYSIDKELI